MVLWEHTACDIISRDKSAKWIEG